MIEKELIEKEIKYLKHMIGYLQEVIESQDEKISELEGSISELNYESRCHELKIMELMEEISNLSSSIGSVDDDVCLIKEKLEI